MTEVVEDMSLPDLNKEDEGLAKKLRSMCNPHPWNDEKRSKLRETTEILYRMGHVYLKKAAITTGMDQKLNFIKAVTLLHGARVRCQEIVRDKCIERKILVKLNKMEDLLMERFSGTLSSSLLETSRKFVLRLEKVRYDVRKLLDSSEMFKGKKEYISEMQKLLKFCTEFYIKMMSEIANNCLEVCGQPPCDFAVVGLGSLARGEVTLYSDFEHVIVLDDEVQNREYTLEYFRWFSVLFHVIVIGFGETIIPSIGIESLNNSYSGGKSKNWFHDSFTPSGVSFDGMMPHACKIPLGRQRMTKKKNHIVELIKPVSEMAKFLTNSEDRINGYCLKDVLSETCFVCGSRELLSKFNDKSNFILVSDIARNSPETLSSEVNKGEDMFLRLSEFPNLNKVDPKTQFYRPLSLLIGYAARLQGVTGKSGFEKASQLKDIPGCEDPKSLEWALAVACEIRFRSYDENCSSHTMVSYDILAHIGRKRFVNCVSVIHSLMRYFDLEVSSNDGDSSTLDEGVFNHCFEAFLQKNEDLLEILEEDRYRRSPKDPHKRPNDFSFYLKAFVNMQNKDKKYAVLAKAEKSVLDVEGYDAHPVFCLMLYYIYYFQGRYKEAKKMVDSAFDKFPKEASLTSWLFQTIRGAQIQLERECLGPNDFLVYCKNGFSHNTDIVSKLLFGQALVDAKTRKGGGTEAKQLLKQLVNFCATECLDKIDVDQWISWMNSAFKMQSSSFWVQDALETWEFIDDMTGTGRVNWDIEKRINLVKTAVLCYFYLSIDSEKTSEKIKFTEKALDICRRPGNVETCGQLCSVMLAQFIQAIIPVVISSQEFKIFELYSLLSEIPQSVLESGHVKCQVMKMSLSIYLALERRENTSPLEICHNVEYSFLIMKTPPPFLYPALEQLHQMAYKALQVILGADGYDRILHWYKSKNFCKEMKYIWKSLFASNQASGMRITDFLAHIYNYLSVNMYLRFDSKMSALHKLSSDRDFQNAMFSYFHQEWVSSIAKFWRIINREKKNSYVQRLSVVFISNAVIFHVTSQRKFVWWYNIPMTQMSVALQEDSADKHFSEVLELKGTFEALQREKRDIFVKAHKHHFPEGERQGGEVPAVSHESSSVHEHAMTSNADQRFSFRRFPRPMAKRKARRAAEEANSDGVK